MKVRIFKKIIKDCIREVLEESIESIITEVVKELSIMENITEVNQKEKSSKTSLVDSILDKSKQTKPAVAHYSKNSQINRILNEVAARSGDPLTEDGVNKPKLKNDVNGLPPYLQKALTRNYSGLMKEISNIKKKEGLKLDD